MSNIPMKTLTIDGRTYDVVDKGAVRFTSQDLTEEQKAQVRRNIGAASKDEMDRAIEVLHDQADYAVSFKAQTLTEVQKAQALMNIGAAGIGYAHDLDNALGEAVTRLDLTDYAIDYANARIDAIENEEIPFDYSDTLTWDGDWHGHTTSIKYADGWLPGYTLVHIGHFVPRPSDITDAGITVEWDRYGKIGSRNYTSKEFSYTDGGIAVLCNPSGETMAVFVREKAVGDVFSLPYGSDEGKFKFTKKGIYLFTSANGHYVRSLTIPGYAKLNGKLTTEFLTDDVLTANEQTLTEEQKAQARANIGAAAVGAGGAIDVEAVLYAEQTLTEDQKAQARTNIGAASAEEASKFKTATEERLNAVDIALTTANGRVEATETSLSEMAEELGDIDSVLDAIIAIQSKLIGGDSV